MVQDSRRPGLHHGRRAAEAPRAAGKQHCVGQPGPAPMMLLAWGNSLLAMTLQTRTERGRRRRACLQRGHPARPEHSRPFSQRIGTPYTGTGYRWYSKPANFGAAETAVLDAMRIQRELGCEPELARSHQPTLVCSICGAAWKRRRPTGGKPSTCSGASGSPRISASRRVRQVRVGRNQAEGSAALPSAMGEIQPRRAM